MTTVAKKMREWRESMSEEQHKALLRAILGPPKKELTGKDYTKAWTLISMANPVKVSNNQRTETEEYIIGTKRYDVTYGLGDKPIIEEYIRED